MLVLCAGGGTSGLLANALNKAAEEYNVPVKAAAGGYGAYGYYERLSVNYFSTSSSFKL